MFAENIVLRIPVLYGPVESLEESAVTCLLAGLKKCQNSDELFKVSNYELRNPSSVDDIAHIIFNLVEKKIKFVSKKLLNIFKLIYYKIYYYCRKMKLVVFTIGVEKKHILNIKWWQKWQRFSV